MVCCKKDRNCHETCPSHSDNIQFAGECSFPIHCDMRVEENPNLLQMTLKTVTIPFAEMEVEEWDNPTEVAAGYLFPPLPGHPMKDSLLAILNAIDQKDIELFDQKKGEL